MIKSKDLPRVELRNFLEITLMWHCSGDIPMDRESTAEFIESDQFAEYLMTIKYWCGEFALVPPDRAQVVKALYELLDDPAYCK